MVPSALRTGLLVVLIALLAAGGPAVAQTADREADLRRQLERTADERDATLDTLSYLKSMQAGERVYFMLPWWIDDDPREPAWGFLTRSEAIQAITLHYLMRIARDRTPFDRRELAREISRALREARTLIADTIDELESKADQLTRQRNELEELLAELDDGPRGRCVHLVHVERENQLGGTMASHAELDDAASIIRTYATANDTQRGYPAQYTIRWTALPERICIGEPFTVTLDITNHLPTEGRSPGAFVSLVVNGPAHFVSTSCTNPGPYQQPEYLPLDGSEAGGTNACTLTFHEFYPTAFGQRWLLRVRAGALGAGEGWLWYEYQER
jgi:hypothetical protein